MQTFKEDVLKYIIISFGSPLLYIYTVETSTTCCIVVIIFIMALVCKCFEYGTRALQHPRKKYELQPHCKTFKINMAPTFFLEVSLLDFGKPLMILE